MRIQLQQFPYNGFDNHRGIDLTAIGTIELSFQDDCPEGIDFLHYRRVFRSVDLRVRLTPQTRLAWDLLKVLPRHILEDHTIFGEYAMTGQRYAHAALQFLRYLSFPFREKITLLDPGHSLRQLTVDPALRYLLSPFRETSSLDPERPLHQVGVDPVRWSAFRDSNTLISGLIKFEELDYVHIMELTGLLLRSSSQNEDLRKCCEDLILLSQVEDGVQAMPRPTFSKEGLQDSYCGPQERPLLLLSATLVSRLKFSFYPRAPIPDHELFYVSFATELAGDIIEYVKVGCISPTRKDILSDGSASRSVMTLEMVSGVYSTLMTFLT